MDDNSQLLTEECPTPKRNRRSTYREIKINQEDAFDSDVMSDSNSNYDPLQDNDQNGGNDELPHSYSPAQKVIRKALLSENSDAVNQTSTDAEGQSNRSNSNYAKWNRDGLASFVSLALQLKVHEY